MNFIPMDIQWLSSMCELWNDALGDHFPMREQLMRQNTFEDVNAYLPGSWLAVDDDGKLLGFITAKKWQELEREMVLGGDGGWIPALVVRKEARNRGIGGKLLQLAENALKKEGVKLVYIGRDPWHYVPGVPQELPTALPWFKRRGYVELYEAFDLSKDVTGGASKRTEYQDGACARLLVPDDQAEMLAFFKRSFPDRWHYEAQCYWERGGQGREFIGLFSGEEMIGFCRVNDRESPLIAQNTYWAPLFEGPLGGIGPLGVDYRYRGKGYGLGLVQDGVAELESRGMKHLVIDWTELVDFYGKLGFKPWKGYDLVKKELV